MRAAFARLRWQLTLSHLLATVFTLLSMLAALLAIVLWYVGGGGQVAGSSREAVRDAQNVGRIIGGLVERGASPGELNVVLRGLADGDLRLVIAVGPANARRPETFDTQLNNIDYIVMLAPDGRVLGSSDPAGERFAPPERAEWQSVVQSSDVRVRDGPGPAALGAAPVTGPNNEPLAYVVVGTLRNAPGVVAGAPDFIRVLAIFGAASLVLLVAASLFALVSANAVAYLLSRRLVARLERLGRAAAALAAGDLSQRVPDQSNDEVGQLGRRFNDMASHLEQTLSDLRAERDRVAGLLEQRRQLVASSSHELRTPVATVRGYLESALGRAGAVTLPAELHADLETMERELVRLQQLIDDLFALSQAEVGRLTLRLESTDVGAVVQQLVATSAPLAWRQRRIEVLAQIEADVPAAYADAQRLEQVVSNLLSNAIRHTPPGGLVAAGVAAEPQSVRIEVRDTGEGISPDDLPHVFERFFRARGNGTNGAGLGLALVKELTEAMGGSVEAASVPGEGSCFAVRLPRAAR